ncbi:MAG: hypothetical protein R3B47_05470 [Bacteroidia bacterium]
MNTSAVIVALNEALSNTQIKLDKSATVSFTGTYTYKFSIPEEKIEKPGYDWKYYVKDVNSNSAKITQDGSQFKLKVVFEGNGSEIKGERYNGRDRDGMAPDINWEGDRSVEIFFKPIAYSNSLSLQVTSVKVNGRFEINGRIDDICKRIGNKVEKRIKAEIQKAATEILVNNAAIKKQIADKVRPHLQRAGLGGFRSVVINGSKMTFCQ